MKKVFLLALLTLVFTASFSVTLLVPSGPTVISVAALIENRIATEDSIKIDFWRTLDQVNAQITAKTADMVILPVSIGTSLYLKGVDLRLAAVTLWSGFYMVAKDVQINSIEDLNGKEIYTPQGKGQTGDVLTRLLIEKHGLQNVKIQYAAQNEIVALMSAGKVKISVLPEPFVTLAIRNASASIVFDMQEIWAEITQLPPRVPITGIFVRGDLLKNSGEILKVLMNVKKSIEYAMNNKQEVIQLSSKYLGNINPLVIEESLGRTIYEYKTAKESKKEIIEYLKIVNQIEPVAIPEIPDDEFFAF
ncbi:MULTISPECIES: ABC transporter substrate-binding protein [Pseudothermotoga]|jgi:NitT/TauT family transport system substrate-binding protein|uniref:Putative sulfonate transport system substrate-binding protein n=1 Tax=Pseudothermotoga lettingae (strain ATCC BAA-301 / DSM 14385 / NBRC 107922 / TMO) TaxID=416591 RepID=A8F6X4_PSELT|nr:MULTISPECIES: MqnA/MqnD/SBP family protein [Pseudothermotoga]ABV33908.1 putative sulfonate transport system substrate-binding protein [Pseudothermotoga lettingae TMO]KUK20438.1 MAG: Putative sulfonate transport system substrate-binding protein [Pseudothermotoga lettingae]MDI3494174.1 NitT/TauT family transport system substrate-binding protein [Pseudothermotoga sp.]MDK2884261.1 NitT/TauT family transport system substrate-binding protein [Pseudothermotoga sp.]GLI49155.1 nitrate ABC transporte